MSKANETNVPTDRVMVLGFSQGTCLASEYVARNPTATVETAVLSGALTGETVDPHIPEERVHESTRVFEQLNGDVTKCLYEGMGHGINEDEIDQVATMVARLVDRGEHLTGLQY